MQNKQARFIVATLTFILGALLYILFLVMLRYDLKPGVALFWTGTLLMVAAVGYKILKYSDHEGFILFEIFLFTLLIHFETVIPCRAGAFGDDLAQYFFTTKAVMEHGFPPSADALAHPPYSELIGGWMIPGLAMYPVLIMNGGVSSMITGLDLLSTLRWLPSVWSSVAILAIYLLSKSLYDSKGAALLAALGFSTYITYIELHSQYTRENVAFVMMLFAIFAFYAAYQKNRHSLTGLAILFAIATVLAHYYVSIMWIGILLVMAVCFGIMSYLARRMQFFSFLQTNTTPVWRFVTLAAVLAFSHWLYMEIQVLPSIINQIAEPVIRYGAPTLPTPAEKAVLKSQIASWGTWVFTITFVIIILWKIVKGLREKSGNLSGDFTLAAVAAILLIIYNILLADVLLHAGRIPVFVYPFMLIVVSHAVVKVNKQSLKRILMLIIAAFVMFNLFRIPIINLNPLKPAELAAISSTAEGDFVFTRYRFPQDPQDIAAAGFYQDAGQAKFITSFMIEGKRVRAEATGPGRLAETAGEPQGDKHRSIFYGIKTYTTEYRVVSPNSYPQDNRVYNNGKVEILE